VADSDTCERSVVRAVADRCFPLPYVANATPTTTDADYWTVSQLNCYSGHRFFISFLTTQCRLGFSRTSVPITSRYDRTPICDRQTQTQTDRQTDRHKATASSVGYWLYRLAADLLQRAPVLRGWPRVRLDGDGVSVERLVEPHPHIMRTYVDTGQTSSS